MFFYIIKWFFIFITLIVLFHYTRDIFISSFLNKNNTTTFGITKNYIDEEYSMKNELESYLNNINHNKDK